MTGKEGEVADDGDDEDEDEDAEEMKRGDLRKSEMERTEKIHLVGLLRAKLDVGGVHVAVTYSTHFHRFEVCFLFKRIATDSYYWDLFRLVGERQRCGR